MAEERTSGINPVYLVVIAVLLWSTGGLFIKSTTIDAYQITFFRSLLAALTVMILTRKDGLIPFCRSEGTSMTATMKPCPTNFSRLRTRKFPETNA